MLRRSARVLWILLLGVASNIGPTLAQTATPSPAKVTTSSLLAQGYAIAGTLSVPSGGAGLFMRKDNSVYFCFLSETPQSPTLATRYCKPVE